MNEFDRSLIDYLWSNGYYDSDFIVSPASFSYVLERAADMAEDADIIVVGAAGNNNADTDGYLPGRIEGIYIAGACDSTGVKLPSSNYGENVFCNVAAESTSEAAARLSALIAEYGIDYLDAAMDNGIVFISEAAPSEITETEEESLPEEKKEPSLLDESELAEETLSLIRNGGFVGLSDEDGETTVSDKGPVTANNVTLNLEKGKYELPETIKWSTVKEEGFISTSGKLSYEFKLKHGERITFSGLPYGTNYEVTETPNKDYDPEVTATVGKVKPTIANGTIEGTTDANISVVYENVCNVERIPATGGMGTMPFYVGGVSMLALGGICLLRRRKRKKSD